jgi:mRNA interferase MazF
MRTGDIVLIPFPFAELTNIKVRPAVVVSTTRDKFSDLILCAISSVVPNELNSFEIVLIPSTVNKLRVKSIIKVDRIITLKKDSIITELGSLADDELALFRTRFKQLID